MENNMESNCESSNEFRDLTEKELLALSDEDKIKYLKEKRSFEFNKAHEALKKSMLELGKVNEEMMKK